MSRPVKCRRVCSLPGVTYFKPAGIPMRFLSEVCLSLEEAESIRLRELENMEQKQCAEHMNISRPTFQRVLASARKKMADALINGKAIRIAGGNYSDVALHLVCSDGHEWDVNWTSPSDPVPLCPICKMPPIDSSLPRCWKSNEQTCCHNQIENKQI